MNEQFGSLCTMETLEAAFGGRWGIWLSDTGRWWAARRTALSSAELSAGCVPFLRADGPAQLAERISAVGFHWSQAGENIATGFPTPYSVVAGWMRSTGHCKNILDPAFRDVGTGVNAHATVASNGTWTQDFGLLVGQRPASGNRAPAAGCPYG